MSLHDPHSVATPSQRLAAAAHQARLAKIAAKAKTDSPVAAPPPAEVKEDASPFSFDDWVRRQERLNPIPKDPWFSIVSETDPLRPSVEHIQRVVARHYGITRDDMISARRIGKLILPRHMGMYFCRLYTLRSFPEIGRRFGNRDHTVPLWACRKIERLIKSDSGVASDVEAIKAKLEAK